MPTALRLLVPRSSGVPTTWAVPSTRARRMVQCLKSADWVKSTPASVPPHAALTAPILCPEVAAMDPPAWFVGAAHAAGAGKGAHELPLVALPSEEELLAAEDPELTPEPEAVAPDELPPCETDLEDDVVPPPEEDAVAVGPAAPGQPSAPSVIINIPIFGALMALLHSRSRSGKMALPGAARQGFLHQSRRLVVRPRFERSWFAAAVSNAIDGAFSGPPPECAGCWNSKAQ